MPLIFIRDVEKGEKGDVEGDTPKGRTLRNIDMAHGSARGCLEPDM